MEAVSFVSVAVVTVVGVGVGAIAIAVGVVAGWMMRKRADSPTGLTLWPCPSP